MNQSKPMLKAPEFILFGFFDLKPFSHRSMISTLSILREAEGEVAESVPATSPPKISSAGVALSD